LMVSSSFQRPALAIYTHTHGTGRIAHLRGPSTPKLVARLGRDSSLRYARLGNIILFFLFFSRRFLISI
jgi:hypothetical protein